jgi:hypothetical protein
MDFDPLAQAADAPRLDVDNAAGLHLDGVAGVARRDHAFVQADRGAKLRLELAVVPDIVLEERLFDQQQVQIIQRS